MLTLQCSCYGTNHFWGEQETSHDEGYGTCPSCSKMQLQKANDILDDVIILIESKLQAEKLKIFSNRTLESKRNFAISAIDKGLITYSFN
ncbi:hypothetical protein UA38_12035 [Photobacterium kishitanii]|uniref:Uncharacterized protein n=1 Tax=Photobacterium kishitanii TaxID=318456 RepID=A0AAX0YQZ7_9GAMM|nr:hypothetical protein [Photobacterium kishitanii]KJG57094.1 hypothetical protein UA38_12035 [Photobacterium kishitanii]KJG60621.1 hypothetical protein UA42_14835 [Photobacterium kishitanii]KJG64924.1 hypothetical protein UA40_14535 [Photobacterium kishitanii]KJG66167.1 hypothetical protein UA41_21210 [Photobacterium kishitanii]PSX18284.1 hypothetical protein C0W70_15545 [Photobacterium kishitanii]